MSERWINRGGLDTLTDAEVQALHYALDQPHLIRGERVAALNRARRKVENETFNRRRQRIYLHGRRDGFAGRPFRAVVDKQQLGSFETMTYGEGYAAGKQRRKV